ncbi:MAG TPA: TolC family protein, partial [Candidatus Baltobacteraceae bacterium]|nr:TolC family protein [Candidatus Baltobacteraceae bacterium]
ETGEPLDRFDRLAPQPVEMPAATGAANAVALALAQRSDLAAAQRNVDAESAAIAVAQRAELPAMTLDAGYTTGVDTGIHVSGPSANLTFAFPLAHEAADRVRAERARLAAAQDAARSIRRHIEVEVAAAARTYAETASAAAAATRARISAQEELRATEIGYRSGASSSLDVATARLTYVQAALDEISAMYAQAQAAATLQQETGP